MSHKFFKTTFFSAGWLNTWRPFFLIFIIGFLLYSQTLFFDFTYLDDNNLILEKAAVLQDVRNTGLFFATDVFLSPDKFYYRPLLNVSFMLDAQSGATLPTVYHLSNILLHILAVCLAFCLLRRLTKRADLSFALALVYLLHPVLVQAVAWVPGRNDVLLAIFVFASFLKFLDFIEKPKFINYFGYLIFLLLALLTKETAALLPGLIIFYWLFLDSGRLSKYDKWMLLGGSVVTGIIWFLMRTFALDSNSTDYSAALIGWLANIPALLLYLGKIWWPFNLAVFPILQDSTLIYGALGILLLILAIIFSKRKNKRLIVFGSLWFLFFLLPSFIRLSLLSDFLEHRVYLSFFGFLVIIAELDWIKNLDFSRRASRIGVVMVMVLLAGLTLVHSGSFRNRLVFWQAAAQASPHSPLAQRNLGVMYYLDGYSNEAIKYYQTALKLNPEELMAHNNIGVIYLEQGDLAAAEEEFKKELALNSRYEKALYNLGEVYYRRGKLVEAKYYWLEALRINPNYIEPYYSLLRLDNQSGAVKSADRFHE